MDDDEFAIYLRTQGVKSLIYTGFASNACVIGRQMGMIPMVQQGFQTFFVPKASAATEFADSWDDGSIHKATTKIISQWIGEIIEYDDLMNVLSSN
jgi:nicotinamidase-related amidase